MARLDTTESDSKEARCVMAASRIASSNLDSEIRCSCEALQPRRARYRGISLIWTAVSLLALILFVGIALDGAKIFLAAHQLQNAADAAALAGALFVKTDPCTARNKAYDISLANYYVDGNAVRLNKNEDNLPDGDIVLGLYYPQRDRDDPRGRFEPTVGEKFSNAVKVVARCTGDPNPLVSLIFGPIVDRPTVSLSRFAIAMSSGGTGAGLIALACDEKTGIGLETEGGTIINVNDGEIQVNCDSCEKKPAIDASPNTQIDANQINVVGCYSGPETDYPVVEDACYMPDPLGCYPNYDCIMPPPYYDETNDLSPAPGVPWTPDPCVSVNILSPGYYSGGIEVMSGDNVVFQPGIYVLDGEIGETPAVVGGLNINGGTICARRVMFYIIGGKVDIAGNPVLTITELVPWTDEPGVTPDEEFCDGSFDYPPDLDISTLAMYEGMAIYQDPYNTTPARIMGTSDWILEGTIYFPFNHVEIGGDGYSVGNQLIANSIWVHTSGEGITINYDGRNRAPGGRSYLVD